MKTHVAHVALTLLLITWSCSVLEATRKNRSIFHINGRALLAAARKSDIGGMGTALDFAQNIINYYNKKGKTALHLISIKKGVLFLLDHLADINASDTSGRTPLHYSPSTGITRLLLEEHARIQVDTHGRSPLFYAQTAGQVRLLLQAGCNIQAVDSTGQTPLHLAATPEVAQALIEARANMDATDLWGSTPVHAQIRNDEILPLLVRAGAQTNIVDSTGDTALELACSAHSTENMRLSIIKLRDMARKNLNALQKNIIFLLSQYVQLNPHDTRIIFMMHNLIANKLLVACFLNDIKSAISLVQKKPYSLQNDLDDLKEYGTTALHVAAAYGYTDLLRLLLGQPVKLTMLDSQGMTPLRVALHKKQDETAALLARYMFAHYSQYKSGLNSLPHSLTDRLAGI